MRNWYEWAISLIIYSLTVFIIVVDSWFPSRGSVLPYHTRLPRYFRRLFVENVIQLFYVLSVGGRYRALFLGHPWAVLYLDIGLSWFTSVLWQFLSSSKRFFSIEMFDSSSSNLVDSLCVSAFGMGLPSRRGSFCIGWWSLSDSIVIFDIGGLSGIVIAVDSHVCWLLRMGCCGVFSWACCCTCSFWTILSTDFRPGFF